MAYDNVQSCNKEASCEQKFLIASKSGDLDLLFSSARTTICCQEEASIPAFRMFVLHEAAQKAELAGQDIIYLTLGKSDLPLHPAIMEAITRTVRDPILSTEVFPGGVPDLRESLAERYSRLSKEDISSDRIFIDAGTSSIYPNLLRILGAAGHKVLLPKPYYPLYRVAAILAGAEVSYYEIDLHSMRIDPEKFKRSMTGDTRVVVFNSPGNPLGNVITKKDMEVILDIVPESMYVIFDEIYENSTFVNEPSLTPMLLQSSAPWSSRTVITNSCSKSYRMYTKRVGWCILPPSFCGSMLALLQHTRLTVDPSVQYGAIEALRRDDEVGVLRSIHSERWKYAFDLLSSLSRVSVIPSSGGFYFTLDCRDFINCNEIQGDSVLSLDILQSTGVATVPGEDFGIPGTIRISFTSNRFHEGIDRLSRYFCDNSLTATYQDRLTTNE